MTNQLIYTGKAKDIYTTEDEHVIKSVYKDQATMLNGARKETIKGKGVLNNQISSLIFEKLNAGCAALWGNGGKSGFDYGLRKGCDTA